MKTKARFSGRQIQPSVSRTTTRFVILIPAINRWAIFDRPLRGLEEISHSRQGFVAGNQLNFS